MAIKIEPNAEPIPGYRLIERLGGGGFGEVWKAEAPGGRHSAIKFVHGDMDGTEEDGARAEQELKALVRIRAVRHSFILPLHGHYIIDGQLMIVMELADRTLWDRFKECRSQGLTGIPRKELLGYLKESAEALDFMYSQYHLLHLDIKPQNLFLVHNHVNVADFGLTKDMNGTAASITGGVTPVYAAPETFDGEGRRSTDQYSLAIVYQELLTGQRPFTGTTARQLVLQHLQAEPDLSSLPPADQPLVRRALSKDYKERFDNCTDFAQALDEATQEKPATAYVAAPAPIPLPTPSAPTNGFATKNDSFLNRSAAPTSEPGKSTRPENLNGSAKRPGSLFEMIALAESEDLAKTPPRGKSNPKGQPPASETPPGPRETEPNPSGTAEAAGLVVTHAPTTYPPHRPAPVHTSSQGVLLPAVVIGAGFLGQATLKQLRHQVQLNFGSADNLPHLRSLCVDSDPEAISQATKGQAALQSQETLLARLHRASHYIKPKDGTTQVQSWLPSKILYRIPRQQIPAGIRALGRLALVDNFEALARRLEAEIRACLDEQNLSLSTQKTGLGVFSASPRVYIVASLAGGTGSGMLLDLAYVARAMLKQCGVENPDVVGVLLMPPSGKQQTANPALANTFAALTELQHYSRPETVFSATYGGKNSMLNGTISAKDPPFRRCILVPAGEDWRPGNDEPVEGALQAAPNVRKAASLLFAELCTRLGREADLERGRWADLHKDRQTGRDPLICQTANLVRIDWPFKQIRRRTAHGMCQHLVQHWMSKDSKAIREPIRQWVQQQWAELNLNADQLIEALKQACEQVVGKKVESFIIELVDPVATAITSLKPIKGGGEEEAIMPLRRVVELLEEFEQLLGMPDGVQPSAGNRPPCAVAPGQIAEILKNAMATVGSASEIKIAELVVRLIEQPDFRLAGAEETLRQFSAILQRALENQEELCKEIQERAATLYCRIHNLLESPGKRNEKETSWLGFSRRTASKQSPQVKELVELLYAYPKYRFQSLVLQSVNAVFVSLRGQMSDQLREVDFCRARLSELAKKLDEQRQGEANPQPDSEGKDGVQLLLPEGCKSVEEAVEMFTGRISSDEFKQLDEQVEKMIRKQFKALVHICMGSSTMLRNLIPRMLDETEKFLDVRMEGNDVVRLYLEKHANGAASPEAASQAAAAALLKAYGDAEPELLGPSDEDSICIVASPDSPDADELRRLARQAVPRTRVQFAQSVDEIVLYREQLFSSLAGLKTLAQSTRQAYQQVAKQENQSPHSRMDIVNWVPLNF